MLNSLPVRANFRDAAAADYIPGGSPITKTFDVLLDGAEPSRITAYDAEEGWVRRWQTDPEGAIRVFGESAYHPDYGPREETLHGVVVVHRREPASA